MSDSPQGQEPEHLRLIIPFKTWNWLGRSKSLIKFCWLMKLSCFQGNQQFWSTKSSLFFEMQLGFPILSECLSSLSHFRKVGENCLPLRKPCWPRCYYWSSWWGLCSLCTADSRMPVPCKVFWARKGFRVAKGLEDLLQAPEHVHWSC